MSDGPYAGGLSSRALRARRTQQILRAALTAVAEADELVCPRSDSLQALREWRAKHGEIIAQARLAVHPPNADFDQAMQGYCERE